MKKPTRSTAIQFHMSSSVERAFQQAAMMRLKALEAYYAGLITGDHLNALTQAALAFRDAINAAHDHIMALDD